MTILSQLSSQTGDRTEASNKEVAAICLQAPDFLAEIASALSSKDAALAGDCAEVLTLVAAKRPELVAPFADRFTPLLSHKTTRVRWEASQALALIGYLRPDVIKPLMPQIIDHLRTDKSVIVRDYLTDALGSYARSGHDAAVEVFPLLKEMLTLWEGKEAGHALRGLACVSQSAPELDADLYPIVHEYIFHDSPVVRKAAKVLLKAVEK